MSRPRASSLRLAEGRVELSSEQQERVERLSKAAKEATLDLKEQRARDRKMLRIAAGDLPAPEGAEAEAFALESMIRGMHALRVDLRAKDPKRRQSSALQLVRTAERLLGLTGAGSAPRARSGRSLVSDMEGAAYESAAMKVMRQAEGRFEPEPAPEDAA